MFLSSCILFCCVLYGILSPIHSQHNNLLPQSKEMQWCTAQSTAESTLRSFWTDAISDCELDPFKLIELYETTIISDNDTDNGKCDLLLKHQLRKSIINTCTAMLEEALFAKIFRKQPEYERLVLRLFTLDHQIERAVWERAIDGVFMFMNQTALAELLFDTESFARIHMQGLIYMQQKYLMDTDKDSRLPVVLACYLSRIIHSDDFQGVHQILKTRTLRAFNSVNDQLKLLYSNVTLRLLNVKYWEYLYAPRENGPDAERRTPLTWTKQKNTTDSDGNLEFIPFSNGNVAIGSAYKTLKFLYVDEEAHRPYFWIGNNQPINRVWEPEWHESGNEGYFTFTSAHTKQLLCATLPYDENRRYVTLRSNTNNAREAICHWKLERFVD